MNEYLNAQKWMHGDLKDIRKKFKNPMASCKQEMQLQQKQQCVKLLWDRGR